MAELNLLGLFNNVDPTAEAINRLHQMGISDDQITVISGAPYRADVLGRPHVHGRVGCAAASGALLGILTAGILTVGLFLLYPLVQGGQPIVPIPPSLIVFFEVTMLGTMWASFLGLLVLSKFPNFKGEPYDVRITDGYIGVEVKVDESLGDQVEKAFMDEHAVEVQRSQPRPLIDQKFRLFWGTVGGGLTVLVVLALLFWYDVIPLHFPSNMVEQDSFAYEQGPRLAAPAAAVPVQGPAVIAGVPASEPLPSSPDSVQRGQVLFGMDCIPCHGPTGVGNGRVSAFFNPKPADLTSSAVQSLSSDRIFMVITDGYGLMPSIAENLSPEERWDVINYVRTLKK